MSSKLKLDISVEAELILRWQDDADFELQITDDADVVQSLTGNTLTLELLDKEYDAITVVKTVTAVLNDAEDTGTFSIDSDFWDGLDIRKGYNYRIRREVDGESKTIVNGIVDIRWAAAR